MKQANKYQNATTYGELTPDGLDEFLTIIEPMREDQIFLDVGSGYGKLVARIADVTEVGRSVGVELVKKRHDMAVGFFSDKPKVELYHGDILDYDVLGEADVVIMNSICWPRQVLELVTERIKPGATILSNSVGFFMKYPNRTPKKMFRLETSWNKKNKWVLFKKEK